MDTTSPAGTQPTTAAAAAATPQSAEYSAAVGMVTAAVSTSVAAAADGGITPAETAAIIITAMAAVSSYTRLSGGEKKQIVLDTLQRVLASSGLGPDVGAAVLALAPGIIDGLYAASQGRISFVPRDGCRCSVM